jgi:hypothetical protein
MVAALVGGVLALEAAAESMPAPRSTAEADGYSDCVYDTGCPSE